MNTCYKCGHEMVTEGYYKANPEKFTTEPRFNHNEHIIQNALFGRLKPNNILCKQCGNDASTDIDKDFVTLFHFITQTIRHILINKDHGKGSINTMNGVLFDDRNIKKRDIMIRDNVAAPKEPFHEYDPENEKLTIYATKARAPQYLNTLKLEFTKNGIDVNKIQVEIVEDISHLGPVGIFFTEGVDRFHDKFINGFRKIAAGYATYCGIPRNQLKDLVEIGIDGKAEFKNEQNVFPFISVGAIDKLLEMNRPLIERHFPSHTLILFSQKLAEDVQHLYCYVDLFSTFQYYILLNDNYSGEEIYHNYHQATAVETKSNTDVAKTRHKYFNLIIDEYQIDTTKYKGTTSEEYIGFLQREVDNYSFNPGISLKDQLNTMMSSLSHNYHIAKLQGVDFPISDIFLSGVSQIEASDKIALPLGFTEYFEDNESYKQFRSSFLGKDNNGSYNNMSAPLASRDRLMNRETMRSYCTLKFNQMSKYIFSNTTDEKK